MKKNRKIESVLGKIRKYLQMHSGDIRLVEVTPNGIARVEFSGACVGCSRAEDTLNYLIKETILTSCPDITDVEAINIGLIDHTPQGVPLSQ